MDYSLMGGSLNMLNYFRVKNYLKAFMRENPFYFRPSGLLCYTGPQGSGKTLSAVKYVRELSYMYPKAILCTNVSIQGLNPLTRVFEYTGIECLTNIENGYYGVIYFIDEIHLEFNSLESKNIPIEVMIEVSQQRKQRKHIIGTTQQFLRLAKPLREQIKNLVICRCFLGCFQHNKFVDGETIRELDGHVKMEVRKRFNFFHTVDMYTSYDTYAKMKRYRQEWKGVSRQDIYERG